MKLNQTVKRQVLILIYAFIFTTLVFTAAFATGNNPALMAGNWAGTFQTPGPSGSLEVTLNKMDDKWSGEVRIQGPGGKILTKQAQNIKVDGENLIFMIEIVGAEMTFTGKLKDGKLSGGLEAVEEGKIVAKGSWEMTRPQK